MQYLTGVSGAFRSFNFQATTPQELQAQNYYVCIRQEQGEVKKSKLKQVAIYNLLVYIFFPNFGCSLQGILANLSYAQVYKLIIVIWQLDLRVPVPRFDKYKQAICNN